MIPKSSTFINKIYNNKDENFTKNPNTNKIFNHKLNDPPHLNPQTIGHFFDNFFSDLLDQTTVLNSDFSKNYTNKINELNDFENFPQKDSENFSQNDFENFPQKNFENFPQKNFSTVKNLENFFIFSTFKCCMFVQSIKIFQKKNSAKNFAENFDYDYKQIEHGKINLLKNYLEKKFPGDEISYEMKSFIFGYLNFSRYEFIYVSNGLKLIVVGNKAGDLHVYGLDFNLNVEKGENIQKENEKFITFEKEPEFLIEFKRKIVGYKVLEYCDTNLNGNNRDFIEIYAIDCDGRMFCYTIDLLNF